MRRPICFCCLMFKVRVKAWLSGGPYHLKPNLQPLETKPRGNNVAPLPPSEDKGDG